MDDDIQNQTCLENATKLPTMQDFVILKPISRGAFGKVFLGHKQGKPEQLYAIKAMKKSDMINKNLTSQVVAERDAMAKVASPFIVNLFYSIQTQQNIILIMEYLIGGDVKSLLGVAGYFDEDMAIMYIAEVTLALEYLHSKHIIHRDLKPDNMLLTDRGHIKLTDFGLSKVNISFNDHVPMTPKTPMPYFRSNFDIYRTPGQILSLSSVLAFHDDEDISGYTECAETPSRPLSELSMNTSDRVTPYNSFTRMSGSDHSNWSQSVPKHSSVNATPKIPAHRLVKAKSMRDVLLSQSTSKYLSKHGMPVSMPLTEDFREKSYDAPVSRLMDTLQASMNGTQSTDVDNSEASSVNISDLSSIHRGSRPVGMSLSCMASVEDPGSIASVDQSSHYIHMETDHSTAASDNVFRSSNTTQTPSEHLDPISETSVSGLAEDCQGETEGKCVGCSKSVSRERNCSECQSHIKVPSRQEKITDDTPQMHRTDESVWNSYAAKNLRSLRCGSYLEDSDKENSDSKSGSEPQSFSASNTIPDNLTNHFDRIPRLLADNLGIFHHRSNVDAPSQFQRRRGSIPVRHKPRQLVKSKSFCYPSSDEDSDEGVLPANRRGMFAKKRSFCDVEVSPVRRTHSADSGLTQEFCLLRCSSSGEPHYKRSHSLPRTRIRFHSGQDKHEKGPESPLVRDSTCSEIPKTETSFTDVDKLTSTGKCRTLSDSDHMAKLSADEQRLVEGQSDTSMSEHETSLTTENSKNCSNTQSSIVDSHDDISAESIFRSKFATESNCRTDTKSIPSAAGPALLDKRLGHLRKPFVSSLRSESELCGVDSPNLSSIHSCDDRRMSEVDESVFSFSQHETPSRNSEPPLENKSSRPMELVKHQPFTPVKNVPVTPLLPPPPPKTRHKMEKLEHSKMRGPIAYVKPSGRQTPSKVQSSPPVSLDSPSSQSVPEDRGRNLSGRSISDTIPTTVTRREVVQFRTPEVKYCHSPRTPHHHKLVKSHSFAHSLKTPYRTPKSVRRAPPPPSNEDERILGTPDYLAPEVLQMKRHGTGVDWWALGICFFEFLTGLPPFNDQTPELVFDNILRRDIPWPEGEEAISADCRAAIDALLSLDPDKRPGGKAVRKMAAFKHLDWHNLLEMEAPWIPQPDDRTDTNYFEARNAMQGLFVSDVDF